MNKILWLLYSIETIQNNHKNLRSESDHFHGISVTKFKFD